MRVGIVYGGSSSEAGVSTKNAQAVECALRAKGYDVCMLEYRQDMITALRGNKIDIVYLCVQGKHHGDGTLQAMLDHERIPYTGSSTHSAMLINDKILCKLLFQYYHIPTPAWQILYREELEQKDFHLNETGFPLVAKAPSQGGSFGIELIHTPEELYRLKNVFRYDDPILLEEFIDGRFYTVGLFEKEGQLVTLKSVEGAAEKKDGLILFTGEYTAEEPQLPESCLQEMEQYAARVFKITGARGVARVDFMVSQKTGKPLVLEINAVPGLKRESLLPRAAEYSGVQYEDLIEEILLSAWSSREGEEDNV